MNILDYNVCESESCNCGWNIILGGSDYKELADLRELLRDKIGDDNTDYTKKITMTKTFDGMAIDRSAN
jgi:hypothetical protein